MGIARRFEVERPKSADLMGKGMNLVEFPLNDAKGWNIQHSLRGDCLGRPFQDPEK